MRNVPRKANYATDKAVNRVYVYNPATGNMDFHSAHTTYLLAQSEVASILRAGYTSKCTLHTKYGMYTYTVEPMVVGQRLRHMFRDGEMMPF